MTRVEMQDSKLAPTEFEQQYLSLRNREGRLLPDDAVRLLPLIAKGHPLENEWKIRKFSSEKLANYFAQKKRPLKILEVGCGNGWLSHRLSSIKNASVVGLDINNAELEQAKRVFQNQNLQFVFGDIRFDFPAEKFDLILFAASIQYFPSLGEIINASFNHLWAGGEIHILDTHFYETTELAEARKRSKQYFDEQGFPAMDGFYFHHLKEGLEPYSFSLLFDPNSIKNKILKQSPFPWIRIKKC